MLMGEGFAVSAKKYPRKTALIFEDKRISYRDLDAKVNKVANMLLGLGLERKDRVAILCGNRNEYIETAMACARIGMAWVPLNSRFVESEIEYVVNNSEAKAIVCGEKYAAIVHRTVLNLKSVTASTCIVIGDNVPSGMVNFQDAVNRADGTTPSVRAEETDILYVGYTSGTTGFPKGALIPQRNRVIAALMWGLEYGLGSDDITLFASPFYHSAPMTFALLHLYMGGTICIMPSFKEEEALMLIEKEKVSNAFLVPTMLGRILNLPSEVKDKYDTSSLRTIISAASPLTTSIKNGAMAFFKYSRLHEFYGATESGVVCSIRHWEHPEKKQSVGLPIFETSIRILDDNGNDLPVGKVGEIFFRSPTRFDGYYGMPEATAESFMGDFQTLGDLGRLDEEGYLYIVGRKKDMIKSGGVNIYPKEIEDVLNKNPKIQEASVIGVPDEQWGESVKAIIICKDGVGTTEEEVIQYCQGKLASYKIPKSCDFLTGDFPRTPFGKILKRELREPYWKDKKIKV